MQFSDLVTTIIREIARLLRGGTNTPSATQKSKPSALFEIPQKSATNNNADTDVVEYDEGSQRVVKSAPSPVSNLLVADTVSPIVEEHIAVEAYVGDSEEAKSTVQTETVTESKDIESQPEVLSGDTLEKRFEYYQRKFQTLRTASSKKKYPDVTLHRAPHKPLLLLAVLELANRKELETNFVSATSGVMDIFSQYWHHVMPENREIRFFLPFFHLKSDGFWHLVPHPDQEEPLESIQQISGPNELTRNFEGAYLDEDLYQIIQIEELRCQLRQTLVQTYFSVDAQTQLLKLFQDEYTEGSDDSPLAAAVDEGQSALTYYEEDLLVTVATEDDEDNLQKTHTLRKKRRQHPPATRRYFDLTAHPNISQQELQHFLKDGTIPSDASWRHVDALLMASFAEINLIGELPINETTFHQIADIIRKEFFIDGKPKIDKVYPALFVTSMVFSARYSDVNARNFWKPYAWLVWGLTDASQYMQVQSREHFRDCRIFLSEHFEHLDFQVQREGDVAQPVFQHVMIPYYLQDDFAEWLLQHMGVITETTPSLLPDLLRNESSLRYVPPRLQRFIIEPDTASAAARLITQMAEAVSLQQDGETASDILRMMSNPIEQAIWRTIAGRLLAEVEDKQQVQRVTRPRLEWVWSRDDNAMRLRLTNVVSASKADLCVWVDSDTDDLVAAAVAEPVLPWDQPDGNYLLDEVILADGPVDGKVAVLAEDYDGQTEGILFQRPVPALPTEPIAFFRLTQQNAYGIPVSGASPNTSGEWLVSMADNITLRDVSGNIIQPRQSLYTPDLLRECAGHVRSGQFSLQFPIVVMQDEQQLFELTEDQDHGLIPAAISGDKPIESLIPNIPPAFENTNIKVTLNRSLQRLSRVTLSIRSQAGYSNVFRLSDLQVEQRNGQTIIDLSSLLPPAAGVYRLNLRQDLKPQLAAPLEFSVLEGITVIGPDLEQVYTPDNYPVIQLHGVGAEDVIVQKGVEVVPVADHTVVVRWTHLTLDTVQLALAVDGERIPLAWRIKRFYAWLSGISASNNVTENNTGDVSIHVRGEARQAFDWIIGEQTRPQQLNAKGQIDLQLGHDTLLDMLRQSGEVRTNVLIRMANATWQVFDYVQRPTVTRMQAQYDWVRQQLHIRIDATPQLKGQYELQLQKQNTAAWVSLNLADSPNWDQSFDIKLQPGIYHLGVLESQQRVTSTDNVEAVLQIAQATTVERSLDCSPAILDNTHQLLFALTQPAHVFQGYRGERWSPFQHFLEINDADVWVKTHGYLPAWCVTGYRLRAYLGNERALYIEPELTSHKGTQGIGRAKLVLEGEPAWAYVSWERAIAGNLYMFKSHLRVFFPPIDHKSPYSWLDDLDLWPAYQCQRCGEIIGSRSGTVLKVNPNTWRIHRHGRKGLSLLEIFHDIGNSYPDGYRLLVMIHPHKQHSNANPWEPLRILEEDSQDAHTSIHRRYQWAYSQADIDMLSKWQTPLYALQNQLMNIEEPTPMIAAGQRMMLRLQQQPDANAAQIFALALLLRSQAYLPDQQAQAIRSSLGVGDDVLGQIVFDAAHHAPALFEWALYWAELLHIHALC